MIVYDVIDFSSFTFGLCPMGPQDIEPWRRLVFTPCFGRENTRIRHLSVAVNTAILA